MISFRCQNTSYFLMPSKDEGNLLAFDAGIQCLLFENQGQGIDEMEVITTQGHSDDSVSLVTDDHEVLIGDLYPVQDEDVKSWGSWSRIHELLPRGSALKEMPWQKGIYQCR